MPGITRLSSTVLPSASTIAHDSVVRNPPTAGPNPTQVMSISIALRTKVDLSLVGTKLAKDRAAESLAHVMIPEVLDYPV